MWAQYLLYYKDITDGMTDFSPLPFEKTGGTGEGSYAPAGNMNWAALILYVAAIIATRVLGGVPSSELATLAMGQP